MYVCMYVYTCVVCIGVDSIVSLHINEDEHIRNLSVQVIEYIGDITPAEVKIWHTNVNTYVLNHNDYVF